MNRRRWILTAGLLAVFLGTGGSFGVAWWLTKAWPSAVGAAPTDLQCQAVAVPWEDGEVYGWLVEGRADHGVVLLLHGWRRNRLVMLDRARMLAGSGYSVLLADLPAHGESSGSAVTFGRDEGAAIDALLAFLQSRFPDRPLGVIGQSLGGAQFLAARRRVAPQAVVLEQTFPTLEQAVQARMRRFLGPLGPALTPVLEQEVAWLRGLTPEQVRPVDRVDELECPLLFIHGSQDWSTPLAQAEDLFAAAEEPKEMWVVEGASHGDLRAAAGPEYERRVLAFLDRHLLRAQ